TGNELAPVAEAYIFRRFIQLLEGLRLEILHRAHLSDLRRRWVRDAVAGQCITRSIENQLQSGAGKRRVHHWPRRGSRVKVGQAADDPRHTASANWRGFLRNRIGIGTGLARPSHTTRHAGPHRAVSPRTPETTVGFEEPLGAHGLVPY